MKDGCQFAIRPAPRGATRAHRALHLSAAFVTVLCLLLPPGCKDKPPAREPGTIPLKIGSKTFHLEVASTPRATSNGLMHRESMPEDHGMLFVFATEEPRGFWMRNVNFPLDIIYLDAGGKVVSIKQGEAYSERTIPSDGPTQFAIELNKGAAAAAGLKAGDTIEIPQDVRPPKR